MTDIVPGCRDRTNFMTFTETESKNYPKFYILFVSNSYVEFTKC